MTKEKAKSLTVAELIDVLKGFHRQGLANAIVSFVTPKNLDNYYLKGDCQKEIVLGKKHDVVELHLDHWG